MIRGRSLIVKGFDFDEVLEVSPYSLQELTIAPIPSRIDEEHPYLTGEKIADVLLAVYSADVFHTAQSEYQVRTADFSALEMNTNVPKPPDRAVFGLLLIIWELDVPQLGKATGFSYSMAGKFRTF